MIFSYLCQLVFHEQLIFYNISRVRDGAACGNLSDRLTHCFQYLRQYMKTVPVPDVLFQYKDAVLTVYDSHYTDKTLSWPSYLCDRNPIRRKTVFKFKQALCKVWVDKGLQCASSACRRYSIVCSYLVALMVNQRLWKCIIQHDFINVYTNGNIDAISWYLKHGQVIISDSVLWYIIIYPCHIYLFLSLDSSNMTGT